MGSRYNIESFSAPIPGHRMKRKPRLKVSYFEQFNPNIIAQFKSVPSVRPEDFKIKRPMMGLCCSCLPLSKRDLVNEATIEEGIRNIFDVQSELGKSSFWVSWVPYLVYGLRRKDQGIFPDVSKAVLTNKKVVDAIQQSVQESSSEPSESRKRRSVSLSYHQKYAKQILNKMKASVSAHLVRLTGWFLLKFLSLFLRTIQVHKGQLQMVEKVTQRGVPVIYVPLHRSHLDYILVTFILWNYGIRAPYVAAGDNLDIPFFNMLMRGLGGFYIRRKMDRGCKKDLIYRSVLNTYMQELLKRGEPFEFFIEGGRTRSGKALVPKGGLLSIVVDSCTEGLIPDAYIVPISISYERLLDGNFRREQMGLPKIGESFFGAWKGILKVLCQNFGSVRLDFAQPFSVKEYIQCNPAVSSGEISPEVSSTGLSNGLIGSSSRVSLQFEGIDSNRGLIKGIGQHIVHTAVNSSALTCTHMVAFLFATKFRKGVEIGDLVNAFEWLRQELKMRSRDVAFCGDDRIVVQYALDLLGKDLVSKKTVDGRVMLVPSMTLPVVFELIYYSNTAISPFLLESIIAHAVMNVGKFSLEAPPLEDDVAVLVNRDQVIVVAEELCKLLQEEFIFVPPCVRLCDALTETLEQFVSLEILTEEKTETDGMYTTFDHQWANRLSEQLSWADEDDDGDGFTQDKPLEVNIQLRCIRDKLQFYCMTLGPILESYLVTAYQISEHLKTEMPAVDFLRQLLSYAQERVRKNIARFAESASMDTLKNALKVYQSMRIVECYDAGNLQMIGLCEHYQVKERLGHYIELLETFKD